MTSCVRSFPTRSAWSIHQRTHTGTKPHQCSECGKAFYVQSALKRHGHILGKDHFSGLPIRQHILEKGLVPSVESVSQPTRVFGGMRRHRGKCHTWLVCSNTEMAFLWCGSSEKHQKIHTREKPFQCATCALFSVYCPVYCHTPLNDKDSTI